MNREQRTRIGSTAAYRHRPVTQLVISMRTVFVRAVGGFNVVLETLLNSNSALMAVMNLQATAMGNRANRWGGFPICCRAHQLLHVPSSPNRTSTKLEFSAPAPTQSVPHLRPGWSGRQGPAPCVAMAGAAKPSALGRLVHRCARKIPLWKVASRSFRVARP
jgi:hypothetical protein